MRVISFYNDIDGHTFYSDHARRLIRQCSEVGIDCSILPRNYGTDWISNERGKAQFILEMFDATNETLIWLDVDCDILAFPTFDVGADWGYCLRHDGKPCDFVHYIEHTEGNRYFLLKWVEEIERCGKGSHTAFINIHDTNHAFVIPDGYFNLVLSETKSKTDYLTKQESI